MRRRSCAGVIRLLLLTMRLSKPSLVDPGAPHGVSVRAAGGVYFDEVPNIRAVV